MGFTLTPASIFFGRPQIGITMKKTTKNHQQVESVTIFDLLDPDLTKKCFRGFKLAFVTFELFDAQRSHPLRVEMSAAQAREFWRSWRTRGFAAIRQIGGFGVRRCAPRLRSDL
jgi:hypothetical protein